MSAELPEKDTCWAFLAQQEASCCHVIVTGTVLRRMRLRVTFRWRTGEVGSALVTEWPSLFVPCSNPQHAPEVAHA